MLTYYFIDRPVEEESVDIFVGVDSCGDWEVMNALRVDKHRARVRVLKLAQALPFAVIEGKKLGDSEKLNLAAGSIDVLHRFVLMAPYIGHIRECGPLHAHLHGILTVRQEESRLAQELEELEEEYAELERQRNVFLDQPHSRIHGSILRHFENDLYKKQVEIADKREELAKASLKLHWEVMHKAGRRQHSTR